MACRALAVCCGGDLAIDASGPRPLLRASLPAAA
jgi:hypothetical protein